MPRYVTLLNFTDAGVKNAAASPKRSADFVAKAKELGVTVKETLWLMGSHDGLLLFDAPDDEAATAAMLQVAAIGNVKTQTMRAFNSDEMARILGKVFS